MMMHFIPPAPSTSILIVPLGPRLVFMTSCKPFAALMFMNNAAALSMDSAFGFTERREDAIFSSICRVCSKKKKKKKKTFKSAGKCREVLTFYGTKEPTFFEKKYIYSARAAVVRVDNSTLLLYLCFYDCLVLVHLWCVSFFDGFKSHVTSRFRRRRRRLETFG